MKKASSPPQIRVPLESGVTWMGGSHVTAFDSGKDVLPDRLGEIAGYAFRRLLSHALKPLLYE